MAALAIVLGGFAATAPAQTIFNENFDGGYAGSFEHWSSYSGGSPTAATNYCAGERRKSERLLAGNHDGNNLERLLHRANGS